MNIKGICKKLNCRACGKDFDAFPVINGKKFNAYKRKYCLDCSPIGRGMRAPLEKLKGAIPEGMRYCSLCETLKPIENFSPKVCYCKECNNKLCRDERLKHKKKIINLKGGCCQICGFNKYTAALDFHHIDPKTKEGNLTHLRTGSVMNKKVLEELEKCILLCANCHRAIHSGELSLPSL